MASLASVWDEASWLADKIRLNQYTTSLAVGESGVIHGLAFELLSPEARISWTRKARGVEKGCFYMASLASDLRLPLSGFVLEILGEYMIAPS